jgi:Putative Ig domain
MKRSTSRLTSILFVALSLTLASCGGEDTEIQPSGTGGAVSTAPSVPGAPANNAPQISGQPGVTAASGTLYTFGPSFSDPDGHTLAFSATGLPRWLSLNTLNGQISGTPQDIDAGQTADIILTVSDGLASASLAAFRITVAAAPVTPTPPPANNQAPIISGSPPTNVQATRAYAFRPGASDPEGAALRFSIVNKPSWAAFSTTTGELTGTPAANQAGTTSGIVITVSDGSLSASLPSFSISVSSAPANSAPQISGTPPTTVMAGTAYDFVPSASDADGQVLRFIMFNKPDWGVFDTGTGKLSGTPTIANLGTRPDVYIGVTDGIETVWMPTFDITVIDPAAAPPSTTTPSTSTPSSPNRAPVISGTPTRSVTAGTAYAFQPTATDADGQMLTFSIANKPAWAAFSTSTGRLSGTPTSANVGTYSAVTVTVSDGAASASLAPFSITVTAAGSGAPTISGIPTTSLQAGTAFSFTPSAQDPEGNTLTFSIAGKPAWASFTTATGTLSGTPASTDIGTFTGIVISVSDGTSSASLPAFAISVNAQSLPIVVQPLGYYTDLGSAPIGAWVTAYGAGFGSSGSVTLGGTAQQIVSYSDSRVVFKVSGSTGELLVGGRSLGQFRVHTGRIIEVTPADIRSRVGSWQAGDVYYLHAGTYSGVIKSDNWNFQSNFDLISSPATADRPIAFVGYPGEVATLTGSGVRPNFNLADSGGGRKANNITIANLVMVADSTCVDSGAGGSFARNAGAEGLRVVANDCTITATGNTMTGMMAFAGDNTTILGNVFRDNPARTIYNNNHAIYVALGPKNVEVAYNTLKNLKMGHVIQLHHDGVAHTYENINIHDNYLEASNPADMRGITVSNVSSASTVKIERNTLKNVGQGFSGVAIYGGVVAVKDNKFYGIQAPAILLNGMALGSSGAQSRTVTATGNRFETTNGFAAVLAAQASMSEIALSGNRYCGVTAPTQETNPLPCN